MTDAKQGYLLLCLYQGDGVDLSNGISIVVSQTHTRKVRLAVRMPKDVRAVRQKKPRPVPGASSPPTHALPRPKGVVR